MSVITVVLLVTASIVQGRNDDTLICDCMCNLGDETYHQRYDVGIQPETCDDCTIAFCEAVYPTCDPGPITPLCGFEDDDATVTPNDGGSDDNQQDNDEQDDKTKHDDDADDSSSGSDSTSPNIMILCFILVPIALIIAVVASCFFCRGLLWRIECCAFLMSFCFRNERPSAVIQTDGLKEPLFDDVTIVQGGEEGAVSDES